MSRRKSTIQLLESYGFRVEPFQGPQGTHLRVFKPRDMSAEVAADHLTGVAADRCYRVNGSDGKSFGALIPVRGTATILVQPILDGKPRHGTTTHVEDHLEILRTTAVVRAMAEVGWTGFVYGAARVTVSIAGQPTSSWVVTVERQPDTGQPTSSWVVTVERQPDTE